VTPVTLSGHGVTLEPLTPKHEAGLRAAGADASVWTYSPEGKDLTPEQHFAAWFARSLGQVGSATMLPFAVIAGDVIVGSTRYLNFEPAHRRVEIGNTWYAPSARGSKVNPACKLLLGKHAFEVLRVDRLELKCDARNLASRAAIAKLGAKEEGTLRKHMVLGDGFTRDTVYFSVLRDEWAAVQRGLLKRAT
jgi:N-acetyltransferase